MFTVVNCCDFEVRWEQKEIQGIEKYWILLNNWNI